MPKPITHRPLEKAGRKPIAPPADAAEKITDLAKDGWSVLGIAHRLGVDPKTFNRWLAEHPALKDAFEHGRESERWALHNMLYRQAMEKGNATAAMFLLKSRHGYREGDQSEQGRGVSLTIALPGAMTLQQFNSIEAKGQ